MSTTPQDGAGRLPPISTPEPGRLALLRWQLDLTWALAEIAFDGLTDEECLWEPAPGAFTVRPAADGRWVVDWTDAEPDPAPATSAAWVLWHIGWWWSTVHDHSFGSGRLQREDVGWPGSARAAVDWIGSLRARWSAALDSLTEADLDSVERTGWPFPDERPFGYVVAWVNAELMKNVAEVGLLRRTFAAQSPRT